MMWMIAEIVWTEFVDEMKKSGSWLFMGVDKKSSIYPAYYALYAISSELLIVHGEVYIGQHLNALAL